MALESDLYTSDGLKSGSRSIKVHRTGIYAEEGITDST